MAIAIISMPAACVVESPNRLRFSCPSRRRHRHVSHVSVSAE